MVTASLGVDPYMETNLEYNIASMLSVPK